MALSFKFSNILGTVYRQGNVVFTADGDCVVSPVGNRASVFDLKNNKSWTLPFGNQKNIARICLSPDGRLIITVDDDGRCLLANLKTKTILHHFNFKKPIFDIKFSPCGKFIAVTHGKQIKVWHAPDYSKEFAPFTVHRTYTGLFDDTLCIDWSVDSRFFVVGSRDMTGRVFSLFPVVNFTPVTLSGHRNTVRGCFFEENSLDTYTVSCDGALFCWKCSLPLEAVQSADEVVPGQENKIGWKKQSKHYYNQDGSAELTTTAFHKSSHLLIAGFSTGLFTLHEVPDFILIHTLSISQQSIRTVAVNPSGEWLAFGCSNTGQLLVWEWQSETYILKQQGHYYNMNTLCYSQDGHYIATGGDDGKEDKGGPKGLESSAFRLHYGYQGPVHELMLGRKLQVPLDVITKTPPDASPLKADYAKAVQNRFATEYDLVRQHLNKVKLWNMMSGFCFVTFSEHSCAVTGVVFTPNSQVVLSCSLDGTVRAFDLNRYRNFRTFTSPQAVQFSCLSVGNSGEVVCAGSLDTFEIFVWCMKTGRLIEVLSGHEGPISELVFSPSQPLLTSGSWDKTVRLWNMFESKVSWETLNLGSDVLTVAVRPDGAQVAVASLDCQITFFDVRTGIQSGSVEGRRDLAPGRSSSDKITAQTLSFAKCFTSLCYTADGKCILAGGRSKFVCIYHVDQQMLLKRFEISTNLSLDGMKEFLHSSNMTEAGPKDLIDDNDDESDDQSISLPGVLKGDMSSRRTLPEVRVNSLQFSPTGQSWAAACTEGLVLYSLESDIIFDPFQLDCDITPDKILQASINKEHTKALVMSLRINELDLVCQVMEEVKPTDIALVTQSLREPYTERLLQFIVLQLEKSRHLHFYLLWCHQLLTVHGQKLKLLASKLLVMLRSLQKSVTRQQQDLDKVCSSNTYALTYILACAEILKGDSKSSSAMET